MLDKNAEMQVIFSQGSFLIKSLINRQNKCSTLLGRGRLIPIFAWLTPFTL